MMKKLSKEASEALKDLSKFAKYKDGWDDELSYCNDQLCNAPCLTKAIKPSVIEAAKVIIKYLDKCTFQIPIVMPQQYGEIKLLFDSDNYKFEVEIRQFYNFGTPYIEHTFGLELSKPVSKPDLAEYLALIEHVVNALNEQGIRHCC